MQRNLRLSHTVVGSIRRTMDTLGFVDVWTPSMTKGTPEGARDFLVPVRLQPGTFFALAQSPQIFKQLCVIGGIDRYYQIATCWRDEDLRADRQFEFRQLDLEMAFVEREEVLDVLEQSVVGAFEAVGRRATDAPVPAHVLRRTRCALRHRQARPPFRPRDPGRDGGHPRLGVRRLRERPGRCASWSRRGRSPARSSLAGGGRQGVGREGPRVPRQRGRRGRVADREVPLRATSSTPSGRSPGRRSSLPPATQTLVERVLGLPPHAPRPRARARDPDARSTSAG